MRMRIAACSLSRATQMALVALIILDGVHSAPNTGVADLLSQKARHTPPKSVSGIGQPVPTPLRLETLYFVVSFDEKDVFGFPRTDYENALRAALSTAGAVDDIGIQYEVLSQQYGVGVSVPTSVVVTDRDWLAAQVVKRKLINDQSSIFDVDFFGQGQADDSSAEEQGTARAQTTYIRRLRAPLPIDYQPENMDCTVIGNYTTGCPCTANWECFNHSCTFGDGGGGNGGTKVCSQPPGKGMPQVPDKKNKTHDKPPKPIKGQAVVANTTVSPINTTTANGTVAAPAPTNTTTATPTNTKPSKKPSGASATSNSTTNTTTTSSSTISGSSSGTEAKKNTTATADSKKPTSSSSKTNTTSTAAASDSKTSSSDKVTDTSKTDTVKPSSSSSKNTTSTKTESSSKSGSTSKKPSSSSKTDANATDAKTTSKNTTSSDAKATATDAKNTTSSADAKETSETEKKNTTSSSSSTSSDEEPKEETSSSSSDSDSSDNTDSTSSSSTSSDEEEKESAPAPAEATNTTSNSTETSSDTSSSGDSSDSGSGGRKLYEVRHARKPLSTLPPPHNIEPEAVYVGKVRKAGPPPPPACRHLQSDELPNKGNYLHGPPPPNPAPRQGSGNRAWDA